jgi:predicted helicase
VEEKNPKWLQDDYVKFIRFAQWKIDLRGEGIVGYITNHGYLDNPTFRGMRYSLLQTFDRIYVLNLHGNILKKEICPDGTKDENVFDIQQGVAISIFVKNKKFDAKKVFHADLFGTRESKFEWLDRNRVTTVNWQEVIPTSPYYLFVPSGDTNLEQTYQTFWSLADIFSDYNVGIVTARDKFTIKFTSDEMWNTIENFEKIDNFEDARNKYKLGDDGVDWKVELAQNDVKESGPDRNLIVPILYRPFDIRYTYFTGKSRGFIGRPRSEIMKHMLKENIAFIFHKREELDIPYSHFLVTNKIVEHGCLSSKTTCYLAPLYLQSEKQQKSNISIALQSHLKSIYAQNVLPEEIFYYIYAIMYSRHYRNKYKEFLKRDIPRIPFVKNKDIFKDLSQIGKTLISLHLGSERLSTRSKFDIPGSNNIKFIQFQGERVYINKEQYFDGVPIDIWEYRIGGYQVLSKWLTYRKSKELTSEDIEHFLQIIEIIRETLISMDEIDKILKIHTVELANPITSGSPSNDRMNGL